MRKHLATLCVAGLVFATAVLAQDQAREFKGHTGLVFTVAFSPKGDVLATGSFDNTVKLWDFKSGKEKLTLKGHTAPVYSVAFSPDGTMIASASQDKTIRVWNPNDGKLIKELKGHGEIVDTVAFSPDSKTLASGSADKSVRLWDPKEGKELKNLGQHKESVYSVAFSPNGNFLASAGNDGFIKVWDPKGQKELRQFGPEPQKPMVVELKKEEKKEEKKEAKKKEEKKNAKKKDMAKKKDEPKEIRDGITVVAFSPDSNQLFSVGFDKFLHAWNPNDGKELKKIGPTPDDLFGLAVSRDGKLIATAGYGGSLRVYELGSLKEVFKDQLKKTITYSVTFTPDGKALVTGHEKDNAARVTPINKK
jgi:WD40 repeat protein